MKSENPTERTMEKVEAVKQLQVGMKVTAPCKEITPLLDNMTDFDGWAIVIQAHSHQFLAGFLPLFAEKQWVCTYWNKIPYCCY